MWFLRGLGGAHGNRIIPAPMEILWVSEAFRYLPLTLALSPKGRGDWKQ